MAGWRYHVPDGTSDFLSSAAWHKRRVEEGLLSGFERAGYDVVQTPAFEYADVFEGEGMRSRPERMVRFFDARGRVMALRPDLTMPIARVAATRMKEYCPPMRLCYVGDAFLSEGGLFCASTQAGVELIGQKSPEGDAEVIALAVEGLRDTGLTRFQLEIGQVAFFKGLMAEAGLDERQAEEVRAAVERKDMLALDLALDSGRTLSELRKKILQLPTLYGGIDVIAKAEKLTRDEGALAALHNLAAVFRSLEGEGLGGYLSLDLGLVPSLQYYTGVIFRGLATGVGEPILSGGRYDDLLASFGRDLPATGFAVDIPRLLAALEARGALEAPPSAPVVIGYAPGRRAQAQAYARTLRERGTRAVVQPGLDGAQVIIDELGTVREAEA
nr:ATP phosphoribosyltransferase regulatory subunit [bacterium]